MPFRWAPREEQFPRPPELRIRVTVSRDRHTIYLAGELDVASAPELKAVLGGIVLDASEVVIDLDDLTFIDSTGLTCILECQESCRRSHTDFLLTPGTGQARRLFDITGLLDRLPFVDSAEST